MPRTPPSWRMLPSSKNRLLAAHEIPLGLPDTCMVVDGSERYFHFEGDFVPVGGGSVVGPTSLNKPHLDLSSDLAWAGLVQQIAFRLGFDRGEEARTVTLPLHLGRWTVELRVPAALSRVLAEEDPKEQVLSISRYLALTDAICKLVEIELMRNDFAWIRPQAKCCAQTNDRVEFWQLEHGREVHYFGPSSQVVQRSGNRTWLDALRLELSYLSQAPRQERFRDTPVLRPGERDAGLLNLWSSGRPDGALSAGGRR